MRKNRPGGWLGDRPSLTWRHGACSTIVKHNRYPLVNFNSSTLKMTNFASGKDCLPSPMTGRVELLIYQRVIH